MKKSMITGLMAALVLLSSLLPVGAVTMPDNDVLAEAHLAVTESVGVDTAGAALGIRQGRNLSFLEGFGYADISAQTLVTPETVFEIGNLSAIFVALAAFRLQEDGILDLRENIATYLPADFYEKLQLAYPITTEQLLLGCAGFEGRTFDLIFRKSSHCFDTLEKALLAEVPAQIAAPATFYADSPFGIALVAYVVECAAGQDYADYVQEKILILLGMNSTVFATAKTPDPAERASGHLMTEQGVFAVSANGGYSFAGLYPAGGMLSTPADMGLLLSFLLDGNESVIRDTTRTALFATVFENGIFPVSAPALSVQGHAVGKTTETLHFGAALWLNPAADTGAFVLTNGTGSALLSLPERLCGATRGITQNISGELPDLDTFTGFFATAASESHSFVGRIFRKNHSMEAVVNEDGTLSFLGMKLKQITPGVFADTAGDPGVAVVQFLLNDEGKVERIVTASGETYLPLSFWESPTPSKLLLYLLIGLAVGFLLAGVFSFLKYLMTRYHDHAPGFIYTVPLLFAALMSLFVLLQVWVGFECGAMAFSSFFAAMSGITLVCGIGATIGFLVSFIASLTRYRMSGRVASSAVFFILFLFLVNVWGLITF